MGMPEMNPILIINGTIVKAETSSKQDLAIENGKITVCGIIDPALFPGYQVIDAAGKFVIPGGFDPHVHFALPTPAGNSCDDFRSGSMAALAGGTTFFMDFVTPRRGQSLMDALKSRRAEAETSLTGYGLHLGISEWNPAIARKIVPIIKKEGITSFKAYLAYRETIGIGYDDLQQLMEIVGPAGGLVMVHCEDGEMIARRQQDFLRQGRTQAMYHALSHPPEAEIRAIEKVIGLSAKTNCPVYIVHTSTREGADTIAAAKRDGIRVFGETCPHYLLLDNSVYDAGHANREVIPYIVSPPLRGKSDQRRLWKGLSDGTFDVISTDHCPFNLHGQKDLGMDDFTRIPNGAGSIEHRLALIYTYGVLAGKISMNQFVNLISTRPAEIFGYGHRKGKLLPGFDADIVIWDPDSTSVISASKHYSCCDSEIYEGVKISGKAAMTISQGTIMI
jgi:dihydropyrimidinase